MSLPWLDNFLRLSDSVISPLIIQLLGLVLSQIPRRNERPRNKATKRTTTKAPESYDDEEGTSDQCPEPDGYFADADQCDKYYACNDGQIDGNFAVLGTSALSIQIWTF